MISHALVVMYQKMEEHTEMCNLESKSSESYGMHCRDLNWMSTDVSEARAATIIRAISSQAARASETSVDIQLRTRQYIPEDSEIHTRRRENLKCHIESKRP
jgi:hypothetical protein